ncbi:transposase [Streptomyces sp. SID625]|nr:transposase [Streptomyces sp. SID625]
MVEAARVLQTARRHQAADAEIGPLIKQAASALLKLFGVSPETASQMLISAVGNPEHMWSEKAFAHLAGATRILMLSGRTQRHRLNHGGDRAAHNVLCTIVTVRMRFAQDGHHVRPQATRRPRGP